MISPLCWAIRNDPDLAGACTSASASSRLPACTDSAFTAKALGIYEWQSCDINSPVALDVLLCQCVKVGDQNFPHFWACKFSFLRHRCNGKPQWLVGLPKEHAPKLATKTTNDNHLYFSSSFCAVKTNKNYSETTHEWNKGPVWHSKNHDWINYHKCRRPIRLRVSAVFYRATQMRLTEANFWVILFQQAKLAPKI